MKEVPENDARAMVRLIAEVAALNSDHTTAKRHLMDGLSRLIGADCWAWTLAYLHPEQPPAYVSLQHAGFDEAHFAYFLKAIEHPVMEELTAPFARELLAQKSHVTQLRQEIDMHGKFLTSEVYPLWKAAGVAPLILSAEPLNDKCVSMIGLYRKSNRPLFSDREKRIAHIILTEVPWLHAEGWPEDLGIRVPTLSRKRRLVLGFLLEGYSRKMIADKMGISIHTVGDYVKEIYRTFGIQSHAELMRYFTRGACQNLDENENRFSP